MCWDAASVAKRGSRLVGLDSRRKVRVLGFALALEAQEEQTEAMKQRSNELTMKNKTRGSLSGARSRGKLAWRSIRDFTEDRWSSGACGRGKVRRSLVECLVGHQGEGEGFLGGGWDTDFVGGDDLDGGG